MPTIKEIRTAFDAELDKIQAKAKAAAAQMNLSEEEIHERLARYQDMLKESATALQAMMEQAEEFAVETTRDIRPALEHLQVQLALGKADSRDAFNEKKKQIQHAIAEFNAKLDTANAAEEREMSEHADALLKEYTKQASALEAELAAMDESFENQA